MSNEDPSNVLLSISVTSDEFSALRAVIDYTLQNEYNFAQETVDEGNDITTTAYFSACVAAKALGLAAQYQIDIDLLVNNPQEYFQ